MGKEQLAQILLPTNEKGGSVSTENTLKDKAANQTDRNIKPTIVHFKKLTGPGYSEHNQFTNQEFE